MESGSLHIASYPRISIDPPSASQPSLSIKQAELVKTKLLLQPACQSYAGFPSTHDEDWIICISVFLVAVDDMDCVLELHGGQPHKYIYRDVTNQVGMQKVLVIIVTAKATLGV